MPKVHREDEALDDDGDGFDIDYSGPTCRHWSEHSICLDICARCGHECRQHKDYGYYECQIDDCHCPGHFDEGDHVPKIGLKAMKEAIGEEPMATLADAFKKGGT